MRHYVSAKTFSNIQFYWVSIFRGVYYFVIRTRDCVGFILFNGYGL